MSAPQQGTTSSRITWAAVFTALVSIVIALIQNPGILDRWFSPQPKTTVMSKVNIRGVAHFEGGQLPPQHTLISLPNAGVNTAETDASGNFLITDVPASLLNGTLRFTLKSPNSTAYYTAYHTPPQHPNSAEVAIGVILFQKNDPPASGDALPDNRRTNPSLHPDSSRPPLSASAQLVQVLYPQEISGAQVYVDRQRMTTGTIGSYNCKIPLQPGAHTLEIIDSEGGRWEAAIVVGDSPRSVPGDVFRKVR